MQVVELRKRGFQFFNLQPSTFNLQPLMRFFVRKRRNAPTVIIVALVDVLIVLLIFLMVTTTFKQQASLHVTLPESSQALKEGASENPPLIVSIDAQGGLRLGESADAVTLEQLQSRLNDEAKKNPQLKLAINADKNAPWGKIVKVMDAAKAANIKSVSAHTKQTAKP
ncbi:MAG TPA: biopolymer transporter ExbD [Verrucomicrobiae bacterium]|nr:biopolymer transporter ExbD [Verrucomicrobiae bacterium]